MKVQEATVPRSCARHGQGLDPGGGARQHLRVHRAGLHGGEDLPGRASDPRPGGLRVGQPLFTGEDVRAGQEVFLRNGLMQYGSIFGHGAYLGPDFTADYLHRAALDVESTYGGEGTGARQRSIADFRTNTYDPATGTVTYSDAQAGAYQRAGRALPRPLLQPRGRHRAAPGGHRRPGRTPASSPPTSRGARGWRPPSVRARSTRTPTTGRPRSWWPTLPRPTSWCGACCR